MSSTISERLAALQSAMASVRRGEAVGPRGRFSWSGLLQLNLVTIPVKAYPAQNSAAAIQFNQLHANCGRRIQHQKRCPVHGAVDAAEITHGYQYAPDRYVPIEPEEVQKLRPARDKALVLEQFVPTHQVDPVLFAGRSLYLIPDGMAARHPYAVVAEALRAANKWGLGRVVLSANRQLVLIRPLDRLLVMDVLHYPSEVHPAAAWATELRDSAATSEEMHLVRALIDAASGPLDWSKYRDTNAEEMTALIEAKIAGQPMTAPAEEPMANMQLLDALKQSVAAARKSVPAQVTSRKPQSRRRTT